MSSRFQNYMDKRAIRSTLGIKILKNVENFSFNQHQTNAFCNGVVESLVVNLQ